MVVMTTLTVICHLQVSTVSRVNAVWAKIDGYFENQGKTQINVICG
jgi:hypothetical protein